MHSGTSEKFQENMPKICTLIENQVFKIEILIQSSIMKNKLESNTVNLFTISS